MVRQVDKVHLDQRDHKVRQELVDQPDHKAKLVLLVLPDLLGQKVHKVSRVHKAKRVLQVHKVQLVRREIPVPQDLQAQQLPRI
jgi:hypothetical protein